VCVWKASFPRSLLCYRRSGQRDTIGKTGNLRCFFESFFVRNLDVYRLASSRTRFAYPQYIQYLQHITAHANYCCSGMIIKLFAYDDDTVGKLRRDTMRERALSIMGLQKYTRLSKHSRPPEVPRPLNYRRLDFGHALCGDQAGVWLDIADPMTRRSSSFGRYRRCLARICVRKISLQSGVELVSRIRGQAG
jgi:hypothetical protein